MAIDLQHVNRVRAARTTLQKALESGTPERIQLPKAWVQHFQALDQQHLVDPITEHSGGVRFWGVPVNVVDEEGAHDVAIISFSDAEPKRVELGAP